MDIKENIKARLREIEVYRSHGLFDEAKGKCLRLANLIRKNDRIENTQELLEFLAKQIKELEKDALKVGQEAASAQMSTIEQDLVKRLFVFSKEKGAESVAVEGAVALLIFGQFEKALVEFKELLNNESLRLVAAKNILRCHIGLSAFDDAVTQYNRWASSGEFTPKELEKIRSFLQGTLEKKGLEKRLLKPEPIAGMKEKETPDEEELIDILSVKIPTGDGPQEEKDTHLDVSYQQGNLVSVIVPRGHQILFDNFQDGMRIDGVHFYSQAVLFKDSCVVSSITKINSGPQKGNYVVVMRMLNE